MSMRFDAGSLARALEWMDVDLSAAYASDTVGMFGVDASGGVVLVNPMAAKMIGAVSWELVGHPIDDFLLFNGPGPNFQRPPDGARLAPVLSTASISAPLQHLDLLCITAPVYDGEAAARKKLRRS